MRISDWSSDVCSSDLIEGVDNADVIAAEEQGGQICIQVFFFRAGRNYGNRAYFPSHDRSLGIAEVLGAFVAQFYENKPVPRLVLLRHDLEDPTPIARALDLREDTKGELHQQPRAPHAP